MDLWTCGCVILGSLSGDGLARGGTSIPADPPEGVQAFVVLDWESDRLVGIEILTPAAASTPTSSKKRKSSANAGTS